MRLPIEIRNCLRDNFSFPVHPLYGQVATVDRGDPDIRTARVYEITSDGSLLLFSHRGANKWRQLISAEGAALCFVNTWRSHQLIARGAVHLRRGTQEEWERLDDAVRRVYAHWDVEGPFRQVVDRAVPEVVPRPFGCIEVKPHVWELLMLERGEYSNSYRVRFSREEEGWASQRIQVA